jgi:hypothetical protein
MSRNKPAAVEADPTKACFIRLKALRLKVAAKVQEKGT